MSMNSPDAQARNDALKSRVDDPEHVAKAELHAIAGDWQELYLDWPESFFVRLNDLLQALVDRDLRKHLLLICRLSHVSLEERNKP